MKKTVADKIRELAKNPVVIENRRKMRAMYHIAKISDGNSQITLVRRTFASPSSLSGLPRTFEGWSAVLETQFESDTGLSWRQEERVDLFPADMYDSNGDRPLVKT